MRIVVVYVQKIRKVGSSDEKLVGAGLTITALYRSIVGLGGGGVYPHPAKHAGIS